MPVFWTGVARSRSAAFLGQLYAFTRTDRFVHALAFRLACPFVPRGRTTQSPFPALASFTWRSSLRSSSRDNLFAFRLRDRFARRSPLDGSCTEPRVHLLGAHGALVHATFRRSRTFVLRAERRRSAFASRVRSVLCPPQLRDHLLGGRAASWGAFAPRRSRLKLHDALRLSRCSPRGRARHVVHETSRSPCGFRVASRSFTSRNGSDHLAAFVPLRT